MQDEYLLKGARKALVENLKKKGITGVSFKCYAVG